MAATPVNPDSFAPKGARRRPSIAGAKTTKAVHTIDAAATGVAATNGASRTPSAKAAKSTSRAPTPAATRPSVDLRHAAGAVPTPRSAAPTTPPANPSIPSRRRASSFPARVGQNQPPQPLDNDMPPRTPLSSYRESPQGTYQGTHPGTSKSPHNSSPPATMPPSIAPARNRRPVSNRTNLPAAAPQRSAPPSPGYTPGWRDGQRKVPPSADVTNFRPSIPKRRGRRLKTAVVVLLVALIAWPIGLLWWADSKLHHVDALANSPTDDGTTYLIVGSDSRADGAVGTTAQVEGARSDSTMLLHIAPNGQAVSVSLPRDTAAEIPDYGLNKLNAAYSFEGPKLLVRTVEQLTGVHVDHYVEVGMGGVAQMVDAVGGVHMCLDQDINDPDAQLKWQAGCRDVDGKTALALARTRHFDPLGDLGRAKRQREIISQVADKTMNFSTIVNPFRQVAIAGAGASSVRTDPDTGLADLAYMTYKFRAAGNAKLSGTPPIADMGWDGGALGSMVLLDKTQSPKFWQSLRAGTLTPEDFNQIG